MIGPELAESDLLPILFRLMTDNNDVREGIMINLSKFIEIFKKFSVDSSKWVKTAAF